MAFSGRDHTNFINSYQWIKIFASLFLKICFNNIFKVREQLESLQQQQKSDQQLTSAPKRKLKNFVFQQNSTAAQQVSSQSHLASFPTGDNEDPRLKKYREQYRWVHHMIILIAEVMWNRIV